MKMYNVWNTRPRKTFRRYVNKQMRESLITGVPEIASCKSSPRRAVKTVLFLMCTAGFFYQTYAFLESFLKYETVQNMRIEYPTKFTAPAITFCNKNRINRNRFCSSFPDECLGDWKFCVAHPKLCNSHYATSDIVKAVPLNISHTYNHSNEFLDAYGPQTPWDFVNYTQSRWCQTQVNGGIEQCKENDSMLLQVPSDGLPYKCFTLFSLFGKPDVEPRKFRLEDGYFFFLMTRPENLVDSKGNPAFYMYVHDPRRLANPIVEGITLNAGYRYTISFSMQQRQTLPPPYDSNCIDYVSEWKENGGRGPITKKECIELCKIERMMEQYSCVGKSITYPHRFPICSRTISISDKVIEACSSGCREACDGLLYIISAENHNILADSKHDLNFFIKLSLKFGQLNIQRIFLEPKFQDIELFSYIGGFMGLWLGISFVTFNDFLETVADVITFAAMKCKKMHGLKSTHP